MICKILANNIIDCAIKANITKFKEILIACYNICTTINEIGTANLALKSLKEEKDGDLCLYYNCTKRFLEEVEE